MPYRRAVKQARKFKNKLSVLSGMSDILFTIAIIAVGVFILGHVFGGARAYGAFKPGFAMGVRTMCDNTGCYPIN